jgi:hypothetical protein
MDGDGIAGFLVGVILTAMLAFALAFGWHVSSQHDWNRDACLTFHHATGGNTQLVEIEGHVYENVAGTTCPAKNG